MPHVSERACVTWVQYLGSLFVFGAIVMGAQYTMVRDLKTDILVIIDSYQLTTSNSIDGLQKATNHSLKIHATQPHIGAATQSAQDKIENRITHLERLK